MANLRKRGKSLEIKFESRGESTGFLRAAGFKNIPALQDYQETQLYEEAKQFCLKIGYVSVGQIQRNFRLIYPRAADLVDRMIAEKWCGEHDPVTYHRPILHLQDKEKTESWCASRKAGRFEKMR